MSTLFDPITFGKIRMSNRLVMAPMTRNRATEDGLATPMMAEYYTQRASAGLIVTEGTQPSVVGQGGRCTPGLHNEEQVESWRLVTDAVHDAGGAIVAQLMHSGRIGHPALYPSGHLPVAPSPIAAAGTTYSPDGPLAFPKPHALSPVEIAGTVNDFAIAARNAIDAGFDGVELHGGNGFLIHQFLADNTNRRIDAYGGSIGNRVRFAVEVVERVASVIGPDRTGLRISPGNPYNDIAENYPAELYATLLDALPPIAFLHVMEAGNRATTKLVRERWAGGLIVNPHPTPESFPAPPEAAQQTLDDGVADAVCLGALFLANPDLPERLRAGGPFNEPDAATFYGGDHRGFTDYPTLDAS